MPSRRSTAPRLRRLRLGVLLIFLPLVLALGSCAGSPNRAHAEAQDTGDSVGDGARGAPIELVRSPERDEIAALEDRRSLGDGRLLEFLVHADAGIRRRAATALGRFPYPEFGVEITNALVRALEDPDPEVRITAAFSLGNRADPASGGVLIAYRNDPEPRMRARVVEAVSKMDDPLLHRDLLVALRDSDVGVRVEAAVGAARWSTEEEGANDVDRALIDALRPYRLAAQGPRRPDDVEVAAELRWRLLYSLSRRGSALGRGAFLEYAISELPLERLFSVRGLGRLEGDPESVALLSRILEAEVQRRNDWRVAYEAVVALGRLAAPEGLDAILLAVEHESAHVRAAALDALGGFGDERQKVLPKLRRGLLDLSTSARASALRSMVRIVAVEDAVRTLGESARDEDAFVRLGAVDAAAALEDPAVVPLLRELAGDPERIVATRALAALAAHPGPETRAFLVPYLAHADNGLRLAAAVALREMPDAADVAALEAAFRTSTGDVASEVAFSVLDTLAAIGGERARRLHTEALSDPRPHVRRVAHRNLRSSFGARPAPLEPAPLEPAGPPPLPGREFPAWTHNPLVEMRTNQGTMVFELFPAEAPNHVHNFLRLAERGDYENLIFHRVVPDFVVQGGDYRGDGNGARPWRGEAVRQEFTPRKYVRGSLGMPRNEDPDSGGSQFFVTHRPTPHLDGGYTIFGELRAGGEVLDKIEVGDRILGVRLLR